MHYLMRKYSFVMISALLFVGLGVAQVSPDEAAKLKTTLTPMGAERAGNKDGTIPAWTGGMTSAPGYVSGPRRSDPFAGENPIFTITEKNMGQYADKLTEGTMALLKKYPQTLNLNVYRSRRTAAYPQWVYDNTFKNATHAKAEIGNLGLHPVGAVGGIAFPIPHNGSEVMWNVMVRYVGICTEMLSHHYMVATDGKPVLLGDTYGLLDFFYYHKGMTPEKLGKTINFVRSYQQGPPIRVGEGFMQQNGYDDESTQAWVYLTGQRRTRKLPNPCCDTPAPQVAGVVSLDDYEVYYGTHLERFDWILKGKKEIYVPYNSNMFWVPKKDSEVLMPHHLNPKYVRWELHRVWVVEAKLKPGYRHQAARTIYYIDEDSWQPLLSDRWDASGHLWKTSYGLGMYLPDVKAVVNFASGTFDLTSGSWAPLFLMNEEPYQYREIPPPPQSVWTPAALASSGIR